MSTGHSASAEAFQHVFVPGDSGWTLLLLHGTGGDEHDLVDLGRRLAPRAALLSPRGKVLENGMPRFFRRLAVGQLDIPDLLARTDELAAWVSAVVAERGLDADRLLALGFSNGANIAASLLLRESGPARLLLRESGPARPLLHGAALLRPMLPYEPDPAPELAGTNVLIAAGEGDPYSSPAQTRRLTEILASAGAEVQVHTEPRAAHGLGPGDMAALQRWIAGLTG